MEVKDKKLRYCLFDLQSGLVNVRLMVSPTMVAGGDFRVFSERRLTIEQFKLSASGKEFENIIIRTPLAELNKAQLAWNILYCSSDPKAIYGAIKIEVTQKGEKCKVTVPTEWQMTDVPPCALNIPVSFTGSLIFVPKGSATL
jgi:hypothetical protein